MSNLLMVSAITLFAGFIQNDPDPACLEEKNFPFCDDKNPLNGYWAIDDTWVPGYPSLQSWFLPAPVWARGNAVFYNQGAMRATAEFRGLSLKGYLDGVALMSPADIGLTVWLRRPGYAWEGPFKVVDSAARGDIYPIIKSRREIVEVGWETAVRWGMVSPTGQVYHWRIEDVEVSKVPPVCLDSEELIDYPEWWLRQFKPAENYRNWGTPVYRSPSTWRLGGKWVTFTSLQTDCTREIRPEIPGRR